MRSAVAFAFAVGALAVPFKRDVDYVTDFDVVYETDIVTVWANAPETSVAVAPVQPTPSSASIPHFGHQHWSNHWSWSQSTSEAAAPVPTTPSSTYEAPEPTTSSVYVPPAPTTTSEAPPPPSPTSTYVAPTTTPVTTWAPAPESTTSSAWVAPTSALAAKPTSYQDIAVLHHNLHRANHSAPDVAWDDGLASSAAKIAASCVYAHNTEVDGGGYGQNIAAGVEGTNISTIISDLFYNGEVNWFDGLYGQAQPDMSNFEHWGHFSQIVWKDTTHVGCATQYCSNGLGNVGSGVSPYFTVCNYKNPGNYANEYGDNVGASLNQPTADWSSGM